MKKLSLFCCFIFLIFLYSPAQAYTISYTDTMTKDGFDIYYQLEVTQTSDNTYSATFDVVGSSTTADWYIGGIDFKFFEGSVDTTISDFNHPNWEIAVPGETKFDGWSVQKNRAGFFHEDAGKVLDDVTNALLVNQSFIFDFTFSGDGIVYQDHMPFQVAYWDGYSGGSQNVHFGQLSATLGTPVPEPGMVILLGIGLIGLAFFSRRRLMN